MQSEEDQAAPLIPDQSPVTQEKENQPTEEKPTEEVKEETKGEPKEKPTEEVKDVAKENFSYPAEYKYGFWFLFFFMGLINNIGTVLILSGAQRLSKEMGMNSLMGLYPIATIICSSAARLFNSKFLINISHKKRIIFLSFYLFSAYIALFVILRLFKGTTEHQTLGFCLTLIPSFIIGTGYAFGESTILGYLKAFPKDLVGGWSSGTGLSGLIGACLNLVCKSVNIDLQYLYIGTSPAPLFYFVLFIIVENLKKEYDKEIANGNILGPLQPNQVAPSDGNNETSKDEENQNQSTETKNKEMSFSNLSDAFKAGYHIILNLGFVYFLEFTALNSISERITHKQLEHKKINIYEAFCMCYKIGVFISRSSLPLVRKIKKAWIFSCCQIVNFTILVLDFYFNILYDYYFRFPILLELGFFGGGAYAACFYHILNSTVIPQDLKELCVNIATICNDTGTLFSGIATIVVSNFIMKFDDKTN